MNFTGYNTKALEVMQCCGYISGAVNFCAEQARQSLTPIGSQYWLQVGVTIKGFQFKTNK